MNQIYEWYCMGFSGSGTDLEKLDNILAKSFLQHWQNGPEQIRTDTYIYMTDINLSYWHLLINQMVLQQVLAVAERTRKS
jgi:hypothetical protein